jgi:hypothetical protein
MDAIGGAAPGALVEGGVEVEFERGFREDVSADVATFHDEVAEAGAIALAFDHPVADFGDGGDVGGGGAGFGCADCLVGIEAIDEEPDVAVGAGEFGFPAAENARDGFGIVDIDVVSEAVPGQGAIHGAGIDVDVAECVGDTSGIGAFAAGAGPVDGDDDRIQRNGGGRGVWVGLINRRRVLLDRAIGWCGRRGFRRPGHAGEGRPVSGRNWETFF